MGKATGVIMCWFAIAAVAVWYELPVIASVIGLLNVHTR